MIYELYDTWGKLVSIGGTLKDTVGVKNPYRYRGYRYDTETGLYYCQSRYYNPEWGRWLNADDPQVMKSLVEKGIKDSESSKDSLLLMSNLFAYCANNPVMNSDPSGLFHINWKNVYLGFKYLGNVVKTLFSFKVSLWTGALWYNSYRIAYVGFWVMAKLAYLQTGISISMSMAIAQNYLATVAFLISVIGVAISIRYIWTFIKGDINSSLYYFKRSFD